MIPFEDACRLVLEQARPLPACTVELSHADGLCLSEDIRAPFDLPRFDSTAVDGFAVRVSDVKLASSAKPVSLPITRTIRAGVHCEHELMPAAAWRVLTGAPVPGSVEAVVMKEFATVERNIVSISRSVKPGENIRRAGEEYQAGQSVLARGTRISPTVIGLLANLGITQVPVFQSPRVTIIITGDELRAAGSELGPGLIYDSNSPALAAACARLGVAQCEIARCPDELKPTVDALRAAIASSEIVVTVGGASVGDYDFVGAALRELAARLLYTSVAIKPGKPNLFATVEHFGRTVLLFGLPGNPVSALLSFHLLIRPAIHSLLGATGVEPITVLARLSTELRKKPGRLEFVRVQLRREGPQWSAAPTSGQESHMLSGLAAADGLLRFPAESVYLAAGTDVEVELLSW
ncbi:molybdopterin molybdotransferase MoeA [candidate division KSB1 bacterium]|nr:molybdopterin molybdotransferase MoeA [candidate division KSB1 bacterium]